MQEKLLTDEEAALAPLIPVSGDICVEADSGGHTNQGVAYALMPAMIALRNKVMLEQGYVKEIRLGAAGGIGTPEAAAAAFVLGADFVMTGSINQCTVEAGTSDAVKDMLQTMNVQDTAYAPAGDMFELGAKVQVLQKGVFFPARANKLYELYMRHGSLEEIDQKTRQQIQDRYFRRSFEDVWEETRAHLENVNRALLDVAAANPKQKMALIFRWYFVHTTRLAMSGSEDQRVDYQINCGPALGAFNQWVKGTELEDWRKRHAADIGERIMTAAAQLLRRRFEQIASARS
jgi:trans-AT polyketide synthase/acyltransferase/oxidoreductase domain-containing protein